MAWRQSAHFVVWPHDACTHRRGRFESLNRCETEIVEEDLKLARVPFAKRRHREARVRADWHRTSGPPHFLQVFDCGIEFGVVDAVAPLTKCWILRLDEFHGVAQQRQCRTD